MLKKLKINIERSKQCRPKHQLLARQQCMRSMYSDFVFFMEIRHEKTSKGVPRL